MVATGEEWHPPSKEHGGVEMGVPSDMCDNAKASTINYTD